MKKTKRWTKFLYGEKIKVIEVKEYGPLVNIGNGVLMHPSLAARYRYNNKYK